MTKLIAFGNQKGGVGKTTYTLNVAGALLQRGYQVAIIDADPQGSILNVDDPEKREQCWVYKREKNGLPPFPAPIEALSRHQSKVHTEILRLLKAGELGDPDYILVDLPPRIEALQTVSTLQIADLVVVPHQMTDDDIGPTYVFLSLLKKFQAEKNRDLKFVTLPNRVDPQLRLTKDIFESEEIMRHAVTISGQRTAYPLARRLTCTVHDLPRGTAILAVQEINELVNKLLALLGDPVKKTAEAI